MLVSSFAWLTNRASQRQEPPNIRPTGLFGVWTAPLKREKAARREAPVRRRRTGGGGLGELGFPQLAPQPKTARERRPSRREEWRFAD